MSLYVVDASDDDDFWLNASQQPIDSVWDNSEDDMYVELLDADNCERRKR
jgi:hypothetical protein